MGEDIAGWGVGKITVHFLSRLYAILASDLLPSWYPPPRRAPCQLHQPFMKDDLKRYRPSPLPSTQSSPSKAQLPSWGPSAHHTHHTYMHTHTHTRKWGPGDDAIYPICATARSRVTIWINLFRLQNPHCFYHKRKKKGTHNFFLAWMPYTLLMSPLNIQMWRISTLENKKSKDFP